MDSITLDSGRTVTEGEIYNVLAKIAPHQIPAGTTLTIGEMHKHQGRMLIHFDWGYASESAITPGFFDVLIDVGVVEKSDAEK